MHGFQFAQVQQLGESAGILPIVLLLGLADQTVVLGQATNHLGRMRLDDPGHAVGHLTLLQRHLLGSGNASHERHQVRLARRDFRVQNLPAALAENADVRGCAVDIQSYMLHPGPPVFMVVRRRTANHAILPRGPFCHSFSKTIYDR